MKGDHKLMLNMINMIRDVSTPLPEVVQSSEEQRIEQVKSQRDKSGHASYDIVNKKNKVSSYWEGWGWIPCICSTDGLHCTMLLMVGVLRYYKFY